MGQKRKLKKTILLDSVIWRGMDSEYLKKISAEEEEIMKVFKAMLKRGICGVSALVPSGAPNLTNIKKFLRRISLLADLSIPVAIVGESGTGKESMAWVFRDIRKDGDKPFAIIDCSTLPQNLFESELFGHVKGAFTGAIKNKDGKIEQAKGGICFIDEVGKMPPETQSKLLRVIENRTYTALGGTKEKTLGDVKFIVSLQPKDIAEKSIILDLLNRLNLDNAINLPPLHERLEKDPYLILDFLHKLLRKSDIQQMLGIDPAELQGPQKTIQETVQEPLQPNNGIDEIKEIVSEEILNSIKTWGDYKKIRVRVAIGEKLMSIEKKAFNHLVNYEGYTGTNFRKLESILIYAITQAHLEKRKEILIEDLPTNVRRRHKRHQEELLEKAFYAGKDIPLNAIIQYGEKIKCSIIEDKIKDVYRSGKEIKAIMLKDLGLTLKEYTNFMSKLPRILGKGRTAEIRKRYK